jgi:CheY-like chemotaxis protein
MTATSDKGWILIVDDDPDVRDALQLWLETRNYSARSAANGRDALAAMAVETPAVALVDLMMPVMSGGELLTAMRQDPRLSYVPVLLVTSWPAEAEGLGAQGQITKPFDLERLLSAIRQYCS